MNFFTKNLNKKYFFVVSFLKNKKTFCLFVLCVGGGGGEGRGGTRVSIFCYKESNPNLKKNLFFLE